MNKTKLQDLLNSVENLENAKMIRSLSRDFEAIPKIIRKDREKVKVVSEKLEELKSDVSRVKKVLTPEVIKLKNELEIAKQNITDNSKSLLVKLNVFHEKIRLSKEKDEQDDIKLEEAKKEIKELEKKLSKQQESYPSDIKNRFKDFLIVVKALVEDIIWDKLGGSGFLFGIKTNGTTVNSNVNGINFINGTVVNNPSGFIDYTAPTVGLTSYTETPTGTIDGANKVFNVAHTITFINLIAMNGQFIHPGDYTFTGTTITWGTAPDVSYAGLPFTCVYY